MLKDFPSDLLLRFVESHRIKGIKMGFDGEGALVVKKSKRISKKHCLEFLNANRDWVLAHFKEMQAFQMRENQMYCFGEWRDFNAIWLELKEAERLDKVLMRIQREFKKLESKMDFRVLQMLWCNAMKDSHHKKVLEMLYKEMLESYVTKRLEVFTKAMDLYPSNIGFGKSYRQLGCCYAKTQKIRFSLRLSLMPKDCIDSVIIHELAHLKYQNHSKDFWNFVEKFDANPKRVQSWLDAHWENLRIYYKVFKP
ncbi:M48 family metallopeptidase [Helicobacter sp.]|uniref:M48 family metallopeptidase n=1 Tax=Helicobacter sp. TaxID=218 RepID=UPI002A760AD7|nr:YgjP-like metallopeptidase domain-containing protein [Helicobacter sp.]MCI5968976.1 M48 family metallopeptidase [Helicobacter sp.]